MHNVPGCFTVYGAAFHRIFARPSSADVHFELHIPQLSDSTICPAIALYDSKSLISVIHSPCLGLSLHFHWHEYQYMSPSMSYSLQAEHSGSLVQAQYL